MGTNMYAYCHNEPVSRYDPSGLFGLAIHDRDDKLKIGTYYWALQFFEILNLDEADRYADIFALANAGIDSDPMTAWWNPTPYANGWHFNNSNTSVDSRESRYLTSLWYFISYVQCELFR